MHEDPSQQDPPLTLPKRTTPTWEMELVLSGATVFALFQGIRALHAGAAYLLPRLHGDVEKFVSLLFTYGQGAVVLLALSFSLHLIMRAYWVALVGMQSVFPSEMKLERTRAGPIAKALLGQRWQSMDASIERADNRATIIFGLGVATTLVLVPVTLMVSLLFGFSMLVARLVGDPDATMLIYALAGALALTPYGIVALIDKKRGNRMPPGSRGFRASTAILRFYSRLGMSRDASPLLAVFQNNIGERRGNLIIFTIMLAVMVAAGLSRVLGKNELGFGSFGSFPDPRRGMPASTHGRHYAPLLEPGRATLAPYIPALVAQGAYLELVVPYVPDQHQHLLDRCDGSRTPADKAINEAERRERLRVCLAGGIDVRVDGTPVTAMPDWYTEPRMDLRGLLYMIPIRTLAEGRHEVSVLTEPRTPPADDEDPPQPFHIPFWR